MAVFLLRAEAVNLGASVYDTDDLSTIRGGGYANLLAPEALINAVGHLGKVDKVFKGASQYVATLTADSAVTREQIEEVFDQVAGGKSSHFDKDIAPLLPHVCLIGVAVPLLSDQDYDVSARRALARVRTKQLQRPTLDLDERPDRAVRRPCDKDGTRPAREQDSEGGKTIDVSASVKARRKFGRQLRQRVYDRIFEPDPLDLMRFADSFHECVDNPPPGLPPGLKSKMAVVHMDGNKFGAIRARHPGRAAATQFSDTVKIQQAALLRRLLEDFQKDKRMAFVDGSDEPKLRFEMLLWGGDECTFVLPAWKVRDLIKLLAEHFKQGWKFRTTGEEEDLTHAVGILVCNYKMPIATARKLVDEGMVIDAKDAIKETQPKDPKTNEIKQDNALSVQILESIEPQAGSLATFRETYYGVGEGKAFTIIGAKAMDKFIEDGDALTNPLEPYPRSQLFGLLRRARKRDPVMPSLETGELETSVRRSLPANLAGRDQETAANEWVNKRVAWLTSDVLGKHPDAPLLGLMRLAEMWELLRPFPKETAGGTP